MARRRSIALCLSLPLFVCAMTARSQQPPAEAAPANVAGKWVLYCNDPNGTTSSKYLDLKQEGSTIKGHFKGVYQSGSVNGTIDRRHLVVRSNTRDVTTFRGRIDGPIVNGVVQGTTYSGTFHNRGGQGTFQGQKTQ